MRNLVIEKQNAQTYGQFLIKLELRNKLSRLRNKLIKKLDAISTEMEEDRVDIVKSLSAKDEDGEPIIVKLDGQESYDVKDTKKLNDELKELREERVAIEVGEYSSNFSPLFEYLDSEEFTLPLSGQDAIVYDTLLDAWENAVNGEDNKEEEK